MISHALGDPATELKQCKKQMLETADRIILVGGIYAGKIAGMKYVKKMERHIKMKKIHVFAVGASAYCDDYLEEIKTTIYQHIINGNDDVYNSWPINQKIIELLKMYIRR